MPINVELLRKVQHHILEEPRRLNMLYGVKKSAAAPCGTIGCIAGWAAILSGKVSLKEFNEQFAVELPWHGHIESIAREEIGLNVNEADSVFYVSGWPNRFKDQYNDAVSSQERAQIAADRIDHFIATEGRE